MAFGGLADSAKYMEYDTVKVEHAFTFNFSERWDKPMRKALDSLLDVSRQFAESFRFIAFGVTAYCVMAGVARIVDSTREGKRPSRNGGPDGDKPKPTKSGDNS